MPGNGNFTTAGFCEKSFRPNRRVQVEGCGRTQITVLPRPTKLSSTDALVTLSGTYTRSIAVEGKSSQCNQRTQSFSSPGGMLAFPGVSTHGV